MGTYFNESRGYTKDGEAYIVLYSPKHEKAMIYDSKSASKAQQIPTNTNSPKLIKEIYEIIRREGDPFNDILKSIKDFYDTGDIVPSFFMPEQNMLAIQDKH